MEESKSNGIRSAGDRMSESYVRIANGRGVHHLLVSVCTRLRKPNRRMEFGPLGGRLDTSSERRGGGETARTTGNDLADSAVDGLRTFDGLWVVDGWEVSGRAVMCERGGKAFSDGSIYSGMNGLGFDTGARGLSVGGAFALARGDW